MNYLPDGEYKKVLDGLFSVSGNAEDGSIIVNRVVLDDKWGLKNKLCKRE